MSRVDIKIEISADREMLVGALAIAFTQGTKTPRGLDGAANVIRETFEEFGTSRVSLWEEKIVDAKDRATLRRRAEAVVDRFFPDVEASLRGQWGNFCPPPSPSRCTCNYESAKFGAHSSHCALVDASEGARTGG